MEAPKCKICGQRHYGTCAVAAPPKPQPVKPAVQAKVKPEVQSHAQDQASPPMPDDGPWSRLLAAMASGSFVTMAEDEANALLADAWEDGPCQPVIERVIALRSGSAEGVRFDRKAYQRDYMRKWARQKREAQRAAKT